VYVCVCVCVCMGKESNRSDHSVHLHEFSYLWYLIKENQVCVCVRVLWCVWCVWCVVCGVCGVNGVFVFIMIQVIYINK